MRNLPYILIQHGKQEKKIFLSGLIILSCIFTMLGACFLGYFNIVHISKEVFGVRHYSIFLQKNIEIKQKDSVDAFLKRHKAENITWLTPKQGKEKLLASLKGVEKSILQLEGDYLPFVVNFSLSEKEDTKTILRQMKALDGVQQVYSGHETPQQVHNFFYIANVLGWSFIILLVISVCFILYNTTSLSTFTRLRELKLLKELGASNYFIFMPLILEITFISILAYLIALGMVYVLFQMLISYVTKDITSFIIRQQSLFIPFPIIGYSFLTLLLLTMVVAYITVKTKFSSL